MTQPGSFGPPELPPYPSAPTGDGRGTTAPYPAPPVPEPGLNGFAVASLVLAICGGIFLSILFGIIALVQMRSRPYRGKGMAIGGLVISGAWVVVVALLVAVVLVSEADRDASGAAPPGSRVSVEQLKAGDCVNDIKEGRIVTRLPVVPCTDPHDGEIIAVISLPPGAWPGEEQVTEQAEQACSDHFETYASSADFDSLDLLYLSPNARGWRRGDRGVTCIAVDPDGPRTGSLRD